MRKALRKSRVKKTVTDKKAKQIVGYKILKEKIKSIEEKERDKLFFEEIGVNYGNFKLDERFLDEKEKNYLKTQKGPSTATGILEIDERPTKTFDSCMKNTFVHKSYQAINQRKKTKIKKAKIHKKEDLKRLIEEKMELPRYKKEMDFIKEETALENKKLKEKKLIRVSKILNTKSKAIAAFKSVLVEKEQKRHTLNKGLVDVELLKKMKKIVKIPNFLQKNIPIKKKTNLIQKISKEKIKKPTAEESTHFEDSFESVEDILSEEFVEESELEDPSIINNFEGEKIENTDSFESISNESFELVDIEDENNLEFLNSSQTNKKQIKIEQVTQTIHSNAEKYFNGKNFEILKFVEDAKNEKDLKTLKAIKAGVGEYLAEVRYSIDKERNLVSQGTNLKREIELFSKKVKNRIRTARTKKLQNLIERYREGSEGLREKSRDEVIRYCKEMNYFLDGVEDKNLREEIFLKFCE